MSDEGPVFIDTNVAVYAYDQSHPDRRRVASTLLPELLASGRLRISVQVLREFFVTVTRKVAKPMTVDEALLAMTDLAAGGVEREDDVLVREAARIHATHQVSYWDALIVASAVRSGAEVLLTEDLNAGQVIEDVRVENPFDEA